MRDGGKYEDQMDPIDPVTLNDRLIKFDENFEI